MGVILTAQYKKLTCYPLQVLELMLANPTLPAHGGSYIHDRKFQHIWILTHFALVQGQRHGQRWALLGRFPDLQWSTIRYNLTSCISVA